MNDEKIVELEEGYEPSEEEEYMNQKQLEYFKKKLLDWKNSLFAESESTINNLKDENLNEPDITDRASVESKINIELRTRDRYRKLFDKIDAALQRINKGTYGFCVKTLQPIGLKRLEARPTATLNIEAQEEHERAEKEYS